MKLCIISEEKALFKVANHSLNKHKTKDNWYNVLGELVLVKSGNIYMENKQ